MYNYQKPSHSFESEDGDFVADEQMGLKQSTSDMNDIYEAQHYD